MAMRAALVVRYESFVSACTLAVDLRPGRPQSTPRSQLPASRRARCTCRRPAVAVSKSGISPRMSMISEDARPV